MNYTTQQKHAIYAHGDSLLVSAAAGSGKTAVLVERVIEKVVRNGVGIENLWIMTFTDAAAAEMRMKIEQAIERELELHPDSDHLHRQFLAVSRANISTVHAACKRILTRHFETAGIDPGVNIGEEAVLDIAFENLLEDFAEELYERAGSDERVQKMILFFSGERNDAKLLEVLRAAHKYLLQQPLADEYSYMKTEDLDHLFYEGYLRKRILEKTDVAEDCYRKLFEAPDTLPLRTTNLWQKLEGEQEQIRLLRQTAESGSFDETSLAAQNISFANWNTRGKAYEPYLAVCNKYKPVRGAAKDAIAFLRDNIFYKSEQQHMADIRLMDDALEMLFSLAKELDRRFAQYKHDKGMLSFDDLERFTVRLLVERYDAETDTVIPTDIAREMREEIDEIIVDEYQDTNRKQDLIFRALSKDGKNIFMVGDVKQSIYAFRQACPELFMQKRENASPLETDILTRPTYLYLNNNFRSHPDILDFVNTVFGAVMTEDVGQVEYDENEKLTDGKLYPETAEGHVELDLILCPEFADEREDDNEDDDGGNSREEIELLQKIEVESEFIAKKIKSVFGQMYYDVKSGRERPIEYGDMAILARNANALSSWFEQALLRHGVRSINNNQNEQFLDRWEIQMLRSYLQVIDNPYRDIPLITLMYSDFFVFSAAELAAIRVKNKDVPFFDAVRLAAETDRKCAEMLRQIETVRSAAVGKRTYEVLEDIFARTYILEKIARYPDGENRIENMKLMMRYALDYEKNGYKGLFAFLRYLDRMNESGKILRGASEARDERRCVRILSIHKSKGLEYPVCFLTTAERMIRNHDKSRLRTHRIFGAASKIRQDDLFYEYKPLPYMLITRENDLLARSEEMRVLYVALTRAKTHLYISSCITPGALAKAASALAGAGETAAPDILGNTPSALRWMLFALREQKDLAPFYEKAGVAFLPERTDCRFTVSFSDAATVRHYGKRLSESAALPDIKEGIALAKARYPFERQTTLPVKLSVSEVKGMRQRDPDAEDLIKPVISRRTPDFIEKKKNGTLIGNAVHKFMQFSDFKALAAPDGIRLEMERLQEKEFLTPRECELVDVSMIENFIRQPIYSDMIRADVLEKEKRFLFSVPAREIFTDTDEQTPILLQGVLDCYFEKDGKLTVLDYKTDRLKDRNDFIDRYRVQLELYGRCLADLTGKTADRLFIYSFHLDELIEIS